MCDSGKGETFCERSKKEQGARKISRCARNDGMGGMGLFHVAYNGYVWKVLFLYRHPERSRGIFLAYWYSVLCVIVEKGKTFAKEARKRGVQGRFLAALEMTVSGGIEKSKKRRMAASGFICFFIPRLRKPILR